MDPEQAGFGFGLWLAAWERCSALYARGEREMPGVDVVYLMAATLP